MNLCSKNRRVLALFLSISLFSAGNSSEFSITIDSYPQKNPEIYGNFIIWVDYRNTSTDIYAYNLITENEFYITKDSSSQFAPDYLRQYCCMGRP